MPLGMKVDLAQATLCYRWRPSSRPKVMAPVFGTVKGVIMTDYLSKGSTVTGAY